MITSRQNNAVKEFVKLRDRKQRDQRGMFPLDGAREIIRATACDIELTEGFLCQAICQSAEALEAASLLQNCCTDVREINADVYEKMAFGGRNDGVLAVAKLPSRKLSNLQLGPNPLVAVAVGIEKPGNLGAILRSADGAGVDAVVFADPVTDLFNPNVIRASLSTVFRPNVCCANSTETIAWLNEHDLQIVATRPDANKQYTEIDYRQGAAIVFGSESDGLGNAWADANITAISLPMNGIADSLNVSASASVLFYEALRQRQQK